MADPDEFGYRRRSYWRTAIPVGAVLGQLLGTFIASNHPELREEVLNGVITMAREIWPILIEEMINTGRCEEDWH